MNKISIHSTIIGLSSLMALHTSTAIAGNPDNPCPTLNDKPESAFDSDYAPLRMRSSRATVIVHRGKGGPIVPGYNALDQPTNVICASATGCILSVISMAELDAINSSICPFVDGVHVGPKSDFEIETTVQSKMILQGTHTLQTMIYSLNSGTVNHWEVDYTLYESH